MKVGRILTTTLLLTLFALTGVGLVAFTHNQTWETIELQKKLKRLRNLNEILPKSEYNNDILNDTTRLPEQVSHGLKPGSTVYRARKDGKPIAVFLQAIAPDGYNGDIELLVGIRVNGELAGVRIVSQRETPGLGDAIDQRKSRWIYGFNNKSLSNTIIRDWTVKKNGGKFDQFTGATISPRAVVKAVKRVLDYTDEHKTILFKPDNRNTTQ